MGDVQCRVGINKRSDVPPMETICSSVNPVNGPWMRCLHLGRSHLEEFISLIILHLHDIVYSLDTRTLAALDNL